MNKLLSLFFFLATSQLPAQVSLFHDLPDQPAASDVASVVITSAVEVDIDFFMQGVILSEEMDTLYTWVSPTLTQNGELLRLQPDDIEATASSPVFDLSRYSGQLHFHCALLHPLDRRSVIASTQKAVHLEQGQLLARDRENLLSAEGSDLSLQFTGFQLTQRAWDFREEGLQIHYDLSADGDAFFNQERSRLLALRDDLGKDLRVFEFNKHYERQAYNEQHGRNWRVGTPNHLIASNNTFEPDLMIRCYELPSPGAQEIHVEANLVFNVSGVDTVEVVIPNCSIAPQTVFSHDDILFHWRNYQFGNKGDSTFFALELAANAQIIAVEFIDSEHAARFPGQPFEPQTLWLQQKAVESNIIQADLRIRYQRPKSVEIPLRHTIALGAFGTGIADSAAPTASESNNSLLFLAAHDRLPRTFHDEGISVGFLAELNLPPHQVLTMVDTSSHLLSCRDNLGKDLLAAHYDLFPSRNDFARRTEEWGFGLNFNDRRMVQWKRSFGLRDRLALQVLLFAPPSAQATQVEGTYSLDLVVRDTSAELFEQVIDWTAGDLSTTIQTPDYFITLDKARLWGAEEGMAMTHYSLVCHQLWFLPESVVPIDANGQEIAPPGNIENGINHFYLPNEYDGQPIQLRVRYHQPIFLQRQGRFQGSIGAF